MTKEPKLKSAVRIVKEWQDYDNEIRRLQESVAAANKKESKETGWSNIYGSLRLFKEKGLTKVGDCSGLNESVCMTTQSLPSRLKLNDL